MLRDNFTAMDAYLPGNDVPVRSSDALARRVAAADRIAFMVILEGMPPDGRATVTVALEHTGDGRHWTVYSTKTLTLPFQPFDSSFCVDPHHRYARFAVTVTGAEFEEKIHVRIDVASRDLDVIPLDDHREEEERAFPEARSASHDA